MSDKLKIVTDHKWKDFTYGYDVPEKIRLDQFSHLDEDESIDGFFNYRGYWYHLSDFMRIEHNAQLKEYDGYSSDSFFSGVVLKLSNDCESYKVGTYCS